MAWSSLFASIHSWRDDSPRTNQPSKEVLSFLSLRHLAALRNIIRPGRYALFLGCARLQGCHHSPYRSHISSLPFTVASRDEPRSQGLTLSRGIESLVMASITGALSPSSHSDPTNTSTLSAKRKRDDTVDLHNHLNGVHESKSKEITADPQSLIQDLIDVLKA